jgi:hypothetical protein
LQETASKYSCVHASQRIARKPVVEDAAGEELVGHRRDHGAPRAVRAREALVVDRRQAMQVV